MYFFLFLALLIYATIQEWTLTGHVYDWLTQHSSASFAVLQILLSFVITASMGMTLLRRVGTNLVQKVQQQLARGQTPDKPLAEGLLLVVAAVLFIVPGYLSDAVGLLIALFRAPLAPLVLKYFRKKFASGRVQFHGFGGQGFGTTTTYDVTPDHVKRTQPQSLPPQGPVIDVEVIQD